MPFSLAKQKAVPLLISRGRSFVELRRVLQQQAGDVHKLLSFLPSEASPRDKSIGDGGPGQR